MSHKHQPHAIMIPAPHQGHINPFINLALKLASKGFLITFVNLEFAHQMLSNSHHMKATNAADLFFEARKSGFDIRYKTISDGLPLDFNRELHLEEFWETILRDFPGRVDEFVREAIKTDPDVMHFLVVDTIYSGFAAISEKYNLVNVSFWTEPALIFSLIYQSELLREKGHFPCKDNIAEEINYMPGIDSIRTKDFMPYLKESNITTTPHKVVFSAFKDVKKANFILHNTVQELESTTLSALSKHQPNYAIGPVNFSKNLPTNTICKSLWPESDCTHWLDSKCPSSVLYVSFGSHSLTRISKQIIEEIAYGLLLSKVNFIWVVRSGVASTNGDNILPDGFENEIKDKGLIIPWCNQIKVLSNSAVKGFLTHCGWNSILESIWCSTPMICYPVDYDQPTNRKLVVDDWKIGINLCDRNLVTREEVAEKIEKLMGGPNSQGLNRSIAEVREKLWNAVEIEGSSERNFEQFIWDLNAKITATTKTA